MANLPAKEPRRYLDPWRDFFNVESLFNKAWPGSSQSSSLPAVNVSEDEKSYIVEVVAPGFKKEDFKISVEDDVLTISAEAKQEMTEKNNDKKQFSRREYVYTSFTRSFSLPENTKDDSISAHYENGILRLTIPKSEKQVKATKEINIS